MISLIAAVDKNLGLGFNGDLLVKIKEDMNWFQQHTYNKPIVMGRKTFESIGKPLSKRVNVVLTRDKSYNPHPNVLVRHSADDILNEFKNEKEIMVCGGSDIYKLFLPITDRMYLTEIDHKFISDTKFPNINWDEWTKYFHHKGKDDSKYHYSFNVYNRK